MKIKTSIISKLLFIYSIIFSHTNRFISPISNFYHNKKTDFLITKSSENINLLEKSRNNHCHDCECDNKNNLRDIPPNSKPMKLIGFPINKIKDYPINISITWNNKIADLDIHLKSKDGTDFPDYYNHMKEYKNQAIRSEGSARSLIKNESMKILSKLPKGEYLIYIFNCSNEIPLINSEVKVKLKSNNKNLVELKIPQQKFNINNRIWRIAFLESDGNGEIILKTINKISNNRDVIFDGLVDENNIKIGLDKPKISEIPKEKIEAKKIENNFYENGKKFCDKYCIRDESSKERKCFSENQVKKCVSCKYNKSLESNDINEDLLCGLVCNSLEKDGKCEFYGFNGMNKKKIQNDLLKRHGLDI